MCTKSELDISYERKLEKYVLIKEENDYFDTFGVVIMERDDGVFQWK